MSSPVKVLLAVLASALASAFLASCYVPPTRAQYVADLDNLTFAVGYNEFKYYTDNNAVNGVALFPYFDWTPTSPACSGPYVGDGPWNFRQPCVRHDFMWGSLQDGDRLYDPDLWNGNNKNAADYRFLSDLYARCGDFAWYLEVFCKSDANLYFSVVNALFPWGTRIGHFS
jgi:hypothetical protein